MEPELTRWSFTFREALPADRPQAQFVVSVGAALNDLLFLNRLYVFDERWGLMRREPTPSEGVYLIRLLAAAVFELMRLVDKGWGNPEVRPLLEGLDEDGRRDLALLRSGGHLRRHYERIRNGTLHYPWPGDGALIAALRALADEEGIVEAAEESTASVRAVFTDTVLTQLLVDDPEADVSDGEREEELSVLIKGLIEHVIVAIRLCQHIIISYFNGLPD